jgi:homopolymeric O-antigen transport system permease protein
MAQSDDATLLDAQLLQQLQSHPPVPVTVIRPSRGWVPINFRELWLYRELLFFLTWRDLKVRYKQTSLGALWAILQPVLSMAAFSLFFGRLAKVPSDGIPYPLFALSGLIPWQLFAYALTQSSNSIVANKNLVSKVYFPRLIVPLAAVLSGLVDFAIAFAVLIVMFVLYGFVPNVALAMIPLAIVLTIVSALAVGLWLSALNVRYRDVQYTIPFLTQFWMFVTPIAYSTSLIPARFRLVYGLNPMAGVVECFRWGLFGHHAGSLSLIGLSSAVVFLAFMGGLAYFRRVEKTFADLA